MSHIPVELLLRYVLDPSASIAADVRAHIAECDICRNELTAIQAMDAEMSDADVWDSVENFSGTQTRRKCPSRNGKSGQRGRR